MFIRKINFNGLRQIYTGELQEFNSYFNMNASTEEELLLSLNSRSKETKFESVKRLTKNSQMIYLSEELEKIAQKELEKKAQEKKEKEERDNRRREAFFSNLLDQDNVKVSLGTATLINDIRLFQVAYDLTSTRCSFDDLMQLKEDTGLTVKFEVTRILHEMETVETNYGRGSDSYEWSDTVISDIESEIIIETYYY